MTTEPDSDDFYEEDESFFETASSEEIMAWFESLRPTVIFPISGPTIWSSDIGPVTLHVSGSLTAPPTMGGKPMRFVGPG